MKRQNKFYRRNEEYVMKLLGLKPTPNSGSGWIVKEDGQNEKIICQLKSTDKESIKINKLDIEKLENNALVEHKIPVFAIQFINNELYLLVKPIDIKSIYKYLKTGEIEKEELIINDIKQKSVKTIKSSENAKSLYKKQMAKIFEKRKEERKKNAKG